VMVRIHPSLLSTNRIKALCAPANIKHDRTRLGFESLLVQNERGIIMLMVACWILNLVVRVRVPVILIAFKLLDS
jgi:hypothetical protein